MKKTKNTKKRGGVTVKAALTICIAALSLAVLQVFAESIPVTISPQNTNPEVKFYSNTAGELHQLTIQPSSGYKFVDPPTLEINPNVLWTQTSTGVFELVDMQGSAEHVANVIGSIAPIGDGGGGGGQPIPFDIDMLTHYFTMAFVTPSGTTVEAGAQEEVSVILANAIGAPGSGTVGFSSTLGTFSGSAGVSSGLATSMLTVTADPPVQANITANASGVDITAGQTASGSEDSILYTVVQSLPAPVITLITPEGAELVSAE